MFDLIEIITQALSSTRQDQKVCQAQRLAARIWYHTITSANSLAIC